jgi:hypothetical protein
MEDIMIQAMTFQFTPNGRDYVQSVRAYHRWDWRNWLGLALTGLLLLLGLCSVASYGLAFGGPLLMSAALLALWPAFALFIIPLNVGCQVGRNERFSCQTLWQVDEQQVAIRTKFAETACDWGTFGRALETKEAFLLVYAANKQMFQVVPKRAFDTPAQEAVFHDLLKRYLPRFD